MIGYILGVIVGQIGLWVVYHEWVRNLFALDITLIFILTWEWYKASRGIE